MGNQLYTIFTIMSRTKKRLYSSTVLFFTILVFHGPLLAQNSSGGLKGSTSLMGQLWGAEVVGVHINHNLDHRVSINAGVGVLLDAHLGTNVYLTQRTNKKASFYIGAQLTLTNSVNLFGSSSESQWGAYLPIGYEYLSLKGFTVQVDIGPNFVENDWDQINTLPFMGSIKLGYTFRKKS